MIAQRATHLMSDRAQARSSRKGRGANGRAQVVCRLRRDWLRQLSLALLLLAFSAFILQPVANASPGGHFVQHDAVVNAVAELCAHSHASGDGHGDEASVKHCDPDKTGPGLLDCCQACLVAAITPDAQSLSPHAGSDHRSRISSDHLGRTPPGILRPPRLITAA